MDPLDDHKGVDRLGVAPVPRSPDVADGQRSLKLHTVRVVDVPMQADHLSRDGHDVTVVHAPRVSVDSGPDLGLPATCLSLPALGVGLAFARTHGAKGYALAGPAVFDQVVVLRLVRREEVGARLEPPVIKTPDRRAATPVEPDAVQATPSPDQPRLPRLSYSALFVV